MAQLPIFKSPDTNFMLMQNKWSSILNPVVANPLSNGLLLTDISLSVGNNTINHKLQQKLQGYIITGMRNAYSQIYQETSTQPTINFILNSSAACVVDIWVF